MRKAATPEAFEDRVKLISKGCTTATLPTGAESKEVRLADGWLSLLASALLRLLVPAMAWQRFAAVWRRWNAGCSPDEKVPKHRRSCLRVLSLLIPSCMTGLELAKETTVYATCDLKALTFEIKLNHDRPRPRLFFSEIMRPAAMAAARYFRALSAVDGRGGHRAQR